MAKRYAFRIPWAAFAAIVSSASYSPVGKIGSAAALKEIFPFLPNRTGLDGSLADPFKKQSQTEGAPGFPFNPPLCQHMVIAETP
ncbi:MAG: hypothetical protein ACLVAW_13985 [Eisenbergiella massiliensis]